MSTPTTTENPEVVGVQRTLTWLIRPALYLAIMLTLYGNVSQAQSSVGGWLSHAWAPGLYLVLVEILVRRAVGGHWRPWVVGLFIVLALIAGWVSFVSLRHAAELWGWPVSESWAFPVIVDVSAVALTCASIGVGARIRELTEPEPDEEPEPEPESEPEPEPDKGGRPRSATSKRAVRELEQAAASVRTPDVRTPEPDGAVLQLFATYGQDPNAWPGPAAYARAASLTSRGTAAGILKRGRTYVERTQKAPEQVPV